MENMNALMIRAIVAFAVPSAMAASAHAQTSAEKKIITIEGSSAMVSYVQKVGATFANDKKIGVTVRANGSDVGLQCALSRKCDIGMSSTEPTAELLKKLVVIHFAADGVAVFLSPDVTVDSLTSAQVKGLFDGTIKNWKEVGGPDLPVRAFHRRESSNVRDVFEKTIGVGAGNAPALGTVQEVVNRMKAGKGMVTYAHSGLQSTEQGKALRVLKIDGVEPSLENVRAKKYKMSYNFYLYRHKDTKGDDTVVALIDHLMRSRKDFFEESGLTMP